MRTVGVSALALSLMLLAACDRPASDADGSASVEVLDTIQRPSTTTTATTAVPTTVSVRADDDTTLLGASVPSEQTLYMLSEDPVWTLERVQVAYRPAQRYPLLVVGEGDLAERPRAFVIADPTGVLDQGVGFPSDGAVIEPVRVGDVETFGRTSTSSDVPITQLEWPGPEGYKVSVVAVGLDLEQTATLAEHVTLDGTTPAIDPPAGYHVLDAADAAVLNVNAHFTNGDQGVNVDCYDDGEVGYVTRQMNSLARSITRRIAGTPVAQRNDPDQQPILLDGAQWLIDGWWCTMWLAPTKATGGEVPFIADDEMEAFLTSLEVVDEATLRAGSPGAELLLEPVAPVPAPVITTGAFSSGEAGTMGAPEARFTTDGTRIVVVGRRPGAGSTSPPGSSVVQFIDSATGSPLKAFPVTKANCRELPISPDGRLLYDGADFRDTSTGEIVSNLRLDEGRGGDVNFSPDGTLIVVSEGRNRRATIYSTVTGDEQATVTSSGGYLMSCAEFYPDGARILLPALSRTTVWDMVKEREVLTFHGGYGPAELSPDGKFIIGVAPRLADSTTGDIVLDLPGRIAAVSPDGSRLAAEPDAFDGQLTIWDIATRTKLTEIPCLCQVSFNHDGTRIATVHDGVGDVHDTTSGALISTLQLDDAQILSAAYSPDGTRIVTANSNGTIRVWPAP